MNCGRLRGRRLPCCWPSVTTSKLNFMRRPRFICLAEHAPRASTLTRPPNQRKPSTAVRTVPPPRRTSGAGGGCSPASPDILVAPPCDARVQSGDGNRPPGATPGISLPGASRHRMCGGRFGDILDVEVVGIQRKSPTKSLFFLLALLGLSGGALMGFLAVAAGVG